MMHPDQIYTVQQLRHEDLQAEVEQAQVRRALADNRTAWERTLVAWLCRLSTSRRRGAIPTSQARSSGSTRTV